MPDRETTERVSRLPLLIAAAVVAVSALLILAIQAGRSPASYPEGSPEAALQSFIVAILDQDEDATLAAISEQHRSRCRQEIDDEGIGDNRWSDDATRAQLEEMVIADGRATAVVQLRVGDDGDPFGGSSWDDDRTFELIETADGWLIDRAEWPYTLARCTDGLN